ncbi:MAG: hypothetical protein Q9196_003724 [Gyalolechia fulgens]
MGDSDSLAQTIIYLRPLNAPTNQVLDLDGNEHCRATVAPPPEPSDIPLDGISEHRSTSQLSPYDTRRDIPCRETTPGLYVTFPRVFRLGFDSIRKQSIRGTMFGSPKSAGSGGSKHSAVEIPYYNDTGDSSGDYFRIHYNFNSGALLITAIDTILVGAACLRKQQSLLLIPGMNIQCGEVFQFAVEFPDLSNCAKEHERNYLAYAAGLGVSGARYLPTPQEGQMLIGREHRSSAILGKGSFGEVHKALRIGDGKAFAIKVLNEGGEAEMKEVNVMSRLRHENIIQYDRAFKLANGQICIVMELAVNDLVTHQKARKNGRRKAWFSLQCIQSIGWQALSALEYIHSQGFTHRDLKTPKNTDTPTIKLADFGLAGIQPELTTYCGTEGYQAPEIIQVRQRLEELQKQKDKGMKTVPKSRLLCYDKSVDIWALGKILHELIDDIPSRLSVMGHKTVSMSNEPALRLIRQMMHEDPVRRPTAAECLRHPWMATNNNPAHSSVQKRDRSPSTEPPLRNVMHRKLCRTGLLVANTSDQGLRDVSAASNLQTQDRSSAGEGLNIRLSDGGAMSSSTNNRPARSSVPKRSLSQVTQSTLKNTFQRVLGRPGLLAANAILEDWNASGQSLPDVSAASDVKMEDRPLAGEGLTIHLSEAGAMSFSTNRHNSIQIRDPLVTEDRIITPASVVDLVCLQGASRSLQFVARKLVEALPANGTDVEIIRDPLSQTSISRIQLEAQPGSGDAVMLRLEWPNNAQDEQRHIESNMGPSSVPANASLERKSTQASGIMSIGSNSSGTSQPSKGITYPSDLDDVMENFSF